MDSVLSKYYLPGIVSSMKKAFPAQAGIEAMDVLEYSLFLLLPLALCLPTLMEKHLETRRNKSPCGTTCRAQGVCVREMAFELVLRVK